MYIIYTIYHKKTMDTVIENDIDKKAIEFEIIATNVPSVEIDFSTIQQNLTKLKTQLSDIQQQLRTLEKNNKLIKKEEAKEAAKEASAAKDAAKETKKSEIDNKKQKKITGFNVCEKMSNELCDFMKLPHNSVSPRTTITKYITEYIHNNKLQDTIERKNIQMDDQLKLLFKLDSNDEQLTYFNIHKYINKHLFEKKCNE